MNTIKINKGIIKMLQRDLEAPSVYELALMTKEQQQKRIREFLELDKV